MYINTNYDINTFVCIHKSREGREETGTGLSGVQRGHAFGVQAHEVGRGSKGKEGQMRGQGSAGCSGAPYPGLQNHQAGRGRNSKNVEKRLG